MVSELLEKIPARLVLYFLSWSGFLVSFMMRNDMNFALVAMVGSNNTEIYNDNNSYLSSNISMGHNNNSINESSSMLLKNNQSHEKETEDLGYKGEFDWSTYVQSMIISVFYWWYVVSQVVGGVATQYFGTKNVFGWSQFATAASSLLIPLAADTNYVLVIILRSIQGFASGLTWPAMYAIVGVWIPPIERSRFMSSFQGFSIGIGLTYPICGFIIAHFGWRYVFYFTGGVGMIWCVIWYFLAFNSPAEHPRISEQEREYIDLNVSNDIKDGQGMKVPWKSIFTSLPAWSIGITTFGRIWVHYTFIIGGPNYMKNILHFSIQKNGFLSGAPFLCSYLSSVVFCYLADVLVTCNFMSLTNVRKVFTAMSQIIPGLLTLLIGYLGDNLILILTMWFIAVSFITASYAGAMASIVDIAPNLAGPVLAFCQTIHMSASFLQPIVAGLLIQDNTSLSQWQFSFGLASVIAIVTYLMFQIYGTSEIQKWNYPRESSLPSEESQEILQKPGIKTTNEEYED
uniref:CSON009539 protein n=1 Tax=Culicoides sonorensis TaxID=179676 RepID=A0A336JZS7_CULSO